MPYVFHCLYFCVYHLALDSPTSWEVFNLGIHLKLCEGNSLSIYGPQKDVSFIWNYSKTVSEALLVLILQTFHKS